MRNALQTAFCWLKVVFEEQKHDQQKKTIAVLDGVRALAIIFVIIFHINRMTGDALWDWHANPLASSVATAGGTGVTLFFVLSGFLLFMPYAKSFLTDTRWPGTRNFYMRRAFRIMPGYYFSLVIFLLLAQSDYLQPAQWNKLVLFLTFFMDSSKSTFRMGVDPPYWTLAVEWQFYMLLPLLMLSILLLVRHVPLKHRLRAVACCLLGVIVLGLFVRFCGIYFQGNPSATVIVPRPVLNGVLFFLYGQSGKYLEDFAVGMLVSLCYIYTRNLSPEQRFTRTLQRLSLWLWGAGILILVFSAMWHYQSDPHIAPWPFLDPLMPFYTWLSEMVLAWGYGLCIMAILFGPPSLQRPFTWLPLRWIGLISYSLYIWHEPLLTLFQSRILVLLPALAHAQPFSFAYYLAYILYWIWTLVVILPFCLLCYIFVEKPGMKLGERWRKKREARNRAAQLSEEAAVPSLESATDSIQVQKEGRKRRKVESVSQLP